MQTEFLLNLLIVCIGFGAIIYLLNKRLDKLTDRETDETLLEWLKSTNQRLDEQSKNFNKTLQTNANALNERLDNAARVILGVQKSIGEMSEIGRSMKDLQDFLRSPKLRGNIGEQVLKELLGQMLPKQSFHLQYGFKSGMTVDAAIKTTAGIIPVDSKFPMENFRKMSKAETEPERKIAQKEFIKDVRRHIDDISKKYILTEEGTIDYALMYIPSESIYYEVINGDPELADYAHQRRVLPVSPTTFYAYLRAILMSFEGQKIEQKAREILSSIRAIQKDYQKVDENLGILGRHVGNAYNMMAAVLASFSQLGQKISTTQAIGEQTKEEAKKLEE